MNKKEYFIKVSDILGHCKEAAKAEKQQIGKTINILKKTAVKQVKANIAEGVRCAVCINHMKSETGCDGNCQYDEYLLKRIMKIIEEA